MDWQSAGRSKAAHAQHSAKKKMAGIAPPGGGAPPGWDTQAGRAFLVPSGCSLAAPAGSAVVGRMVRTTTQRPADIGLLAAPSRRGALINAGEAIPRA